MNTNKVISILTLINLNRHKAYLGCSLFYFSLYNRYKTGRIIRWRAVLGWNTKADLMMNKIWALCVLWTDTRQMKRFLGLAIPRQMMRAEPVLSDIIVLSQPPLQTPNIIYERLDIFFLCFFLFFCLRQMCWTVSTDWWSLQSEEVPRGEQFRANWRGTSSFLAQGATVISQSEFAESDAFVTCFCRAGHSIYQSVAIYSMIANTNVTSLPWT